MRDRLIQHSKDPSCAVCHSLMDDIGLSFEMYEHWGKRRTTEAGKPVNAAGRISGAGDADGTFNDATDLARLLAGSRTVERCFVRHAFRFWMGRDEQDADACSLDAAAKAFAGNGDLLELLATLATTSSFLDRSTP
jgi:hypothetical protein